jgi:nucleotide-binding universal stress UspA family protein
MNADAVIMGTSGESGLLASLLGSVTAAVATRSEIPVIAVPQNTVYRSFKNVVFGNDHKEPISKELATIHKFFNGSQTKLHIVSVQADKEKYVQEVVCEEGGVKEVAIWASSVNEGLKEYLEKENADILAVKHHTRGFIADLFHKSTTKELLKDCSIPLFIF